MGTGKECAKEGGGGVPEINVTQGQRILAGYILWMTLLVVAYYQLPGLRVGAWALLGLSGVGAIAAGVVINRPARKVPWLLIAAANLSFLAGQTSFLVMTKIKMQVPFPSYADGLYLAQYPLCVAGVLGFIRWRSPNRDRRSLIDALILTVGLALLSWLYLILPYARNPELTWLQKSVAIAYPLGDILVLAIMARLLAPGMVRARSVQLLTLGAIGVLASDVSYGLIQLHGTFHNGTIFDLGWAILYTAWGAAALHPTMIQLTRPVTMQRAEASPLRLTVLMLAALIAPTVLFIESIKAHYVDGSVVAVFSAVLYLLVLSRLWDVASSHRRALSRERTVRLAGASLAAAGTVKDAASAVGNAAVALIGPDALPDAVLVVRMDGQFEAVTAGDLPQRARARQSARSRPPPRPEQLGELAEAWLPRLTGPSPVFVPAADLGERVPALYPDCEGALLCPLMLKERPSGDPLIGMLAVFGQQRVLADLSGTLEILAGQVALAVERVMLSQEVIRQRSESYFRTLVQDTSDVILIVGDDGEVRYATPSATSIFGDIEIEGTTLSSLAAPTGPTDVSRALTRMRDHADQDHYDEFWHLRRWDGRSVQVHVQCSDLRDDRTVRGLVLTLRDVTEQRELEDELTYRAFHDSLTGLPNRLLFQDRAAHGLAQARRGGKITGVLFVDLDDFKLVNDTMGHAVGDELLAAVGARLAAAVRESDTAARLGGDEFALIIEQVQDSAEVDALAERIVQAFSKPFSLRDASVVTTATVGVATTEDSTDVDELLRHADLALYAAKAAGKRQWRRYQPVLSAGMVRRREVQAALEDAVNNSAFTLAYQPIVALTSGEIVGFEALVRWPHPEWGMMLPGQFISIAEETGHIVPLGAWVLRQATADMARWRGQAGGEQLPYVSVNVSARQFRTGGFMDDVVGQALQTSGLPPSALMLEITESLLLNRDEQIHDDLTKLKLIGVRLAIDDFGTGYSSLSYLRELPIDVLKIDKSFVDGITASQQQFVLVEGIIGIAKKLDLEVIAEGIETDAQREMLLAMGCHYGQGYLLAMPGSAAETERLIQQQQRLTPDLPASRQSPK
jgi:diguanylate cyclase (GGDEF)-like protein/PAS domain S-box-containing protein